MKRRVVHALLHDNAFARGKKGQVTVGDLGKNLPPDNKTFKKFEMTLIDDILYVELVPLDEARKVRSELAIPITNVKCMSLDTEESDDGKSAATEEKTDS